MSTDTHNVLPATCTDPAPSDRIINDREPEDLSVATGGSDSTREQPVGSDHACAEQPEFVDRTHELSARPVPPSIAETAWNEDDTEPGDDIGNRRDGPAHHERTASGSKTLDATKPRGRRDRKNVSPRDTDRHQRDANMVENGAAAVPARRQGRRGAHSPPLRERPAFRVGEEVFGRIIEVTDAAILVDLSGKAHGIFDRQNLASDDAPQIGDHFVAQVLDDGSRGGLVVLTRKAPQIERVRDKLAACSSSGELVSGLVTGVVKGGVEVYVDGIRAFAPGSHVDLKLGVDLHFLVGKRLPFKVMKYANNGREIVLTRRELLEQEAVQARMQALAQLVPGSIVKAIVRSVVDWGVFVSIPDANNVEGLVHVSEASHDRNCRLASLFHVGDEVDVKVLRVDDKGKLWLSRKAVTGDPWESAIARFAVGTRHVGRVARIQPFGAFVELAPGIDGLVRTADLSMRRVNDPAEAVSIDDEIDVIVVHVEPAQRKIGLHPAPPKDENAPTQRVALHRIVRTAVVAADPAGLLVRILGATGAASRGFIPAGQTGTSRGTDLRREFPVGTVLEAKIIDMDPRRGECKLSIRAMKEDTEKAAFNEYRATVARESKFGTFGDLFAKRNGS